MDDRITKKAIRDKAITAATKMTQNFHPTPLSGEAVVSRSTTFPDGVGAICGVATGAGARGSRGNVCSGSYVMFSSGSKIRASPGPRTGGFVIGIVPGGSDGGACVGEVFFGGGSKARIADSESVDIFYRKKKI
jgi:hypothetical protein